MSTIAVRVSIQHQGRALPFTPIMRRFEDTTNESQVIDELYATNDNQNPQEAGSAIAPAVALTFDAPTVVQINSNLGTKSFQLRGDSALVIMNGIPVTFAPTAGSRVRGIA